MIRIVAAVCLALAISGVVQAQAKKNLKDEISQSEKAARVFREIMDTPDKGIPQESLGTAQSFAVLGSSTVTNTGMTTVTGDLGVSPGTAITGFPPGVVIGGTIHANDVVAMQAQNDVTTAYNALAGQACNTVLTGTDLGGLTLKPGVYCFTSSAQLTGTLTLDAQGNPNAVFVFQIASTLTTASNSSVLTINGSQNCNVFWQVGSSATLGTGTVFVGNILALASITLNTGATLSGRALARTGAVTLDTNAVSASNCSTKKAQTKAKPAKAKPAPAKAKKSPGKKGKSEYTTWKVNRIWSA